MKCDDADAMIDAFVEDALDATQRRVVAEHAAACARCGRAVERSRRLSASLAAMPVASPSAAADARVLAAVAEEIAWSRWRARMRRRLAGAAAAVLVAGAATAAFVATPAYAWLVERAVRLVHVGETWARFGAAPALERAQGTILATLAILVVAAVMDRAFSRDEEAARSGG